MHKTLKRIILAALFICLSGFAFIPLLINASTGLAVGAAIGTIVFPQTWKNLNDLLNGENPSTLASVPENLPISRDRPLQPVTTPANSLNPQSVTKYGGSGTCAKYGSSTNVNVASSFDTCNAGRNAACGQCDGMVYTSGTYCNGGNTGSFSMAPSCPSTIQNTCPSGYTLSGSTCSLTNPAIVPDGKCNGSFSGRDSDCGTATTPTTYDAGGKAFNSGKALARSGYVPDGAGGGKYIESEILSIEGSTDSSILKIRKQNPSGGTVETNATIQNGIITAVQNTSLPYNIVPYGQTYYDSKEYDAYKSGGAAPVLQTRNPETSMGQGAYYTGETASITSGGSTATGRIASTDLQTLNQRNVYTQQNSTTQPNTTSVNGSTVSTSTNQIPNNLTAQVVAVSNLPSDYVRPTDIQIQTSTITTAIEAVKTQLQDDGSTIDDLSVPVLTNPIQPIIDSLNPLKSYNFSTTSISCPTFDITAFDRTYILNSHCPIIENNKTNIQIIANLAAMVMALIIVLSA